MAEPGFEPELSALLEIARRAHAPALAPLAERRMVRRALAAAERPRRPARQRWWALAAASLLLCGAAAVFVSLRAATRVQVSASGLPLRLALKTGDALTLAPGSELLVLEETPRLRKVQLTRGSVLFEIARLQRGHGFWVQTEHGEVGVLGTVFSVQTDARRTQVRVYEGRVAVGTRVLQAGQSWASSGQVSGPVPFASEAKAAAKLRARVEAPAVTSSPVSSAQPHVVMALPSAGANTASSLHARAEPRTSTSSTVPRVSLPAPALTVAEILAPAHQLRAEGRFAEAAAAYEAVASSSTGASAIEAGHAAAQLAQHTLAQSERALVNVERFGLTEPGSALRERARLLRIEALWTLGRHDEARTYVREYLREEQPTETSRRLRALLDR